MPPVWRIVFVYFLTVIQNLQANKLFRLHTFFVGAITTQGPVG